MSITVIDPKLQALAQRVTVLERQNAILHAALLKPPTLTSDRERLACIGYALQLTERSPS